MAEAATLDISLTSVTALIRRPIFGKQNSAATSNDVTRFFEARLFTFHLSS